MKRTIAISFFLLTSGLSAQDTTFFAPEGYPVFTWFDAETYSVFEPSDTADVLEETAYFLDNNLKRQCTYSDYARNIRHGKCTEFYEGGKAKYRAEYKEGLKHGNIISFYPDGKMKRQDFYRNDTLVSGWCYSPSGKREKHHPFEVKPQHPEGEVGFMNELAERLDLKEEGDTVIVEFWITHDGQVRAAEATCDHPEAARMVEKAFLNLNPWRPGLRDGEPDVFREFITLYLDAEGIQGKDE